MIYIRVYEVFSTHTADRVSAYFLFLIVGNGSGVWSSSKKPDRSDCGLTIYRSY